MTLKHVKAVDLLFRGCGLLSEIFEDLRMFRAIFALLFCLWSVTSMAGGALPAKKIGSVSFNEKGFFLSPPAGEKWANPNGCTRDTAIVLLNTDSNYDKAYALLLAAYMAGKSVGGYSNGCADHDGQTYNTIRGYKYLSVQ